MKRKFNLAIKTSFSRLFQPFFNNFYHLDRAQQSAENETNGKNKLNELAQNLKFQQQKPDVSVADGQKQLIETNANQGIFGNHIYKTAQANDKSWYSFGIAYILFFVFLIICFID